MTNKKKIINDPVYGFIKIRSELIYELIQHPFFQRLRRIKQLGLTDFVYPGALHTRFHHALGAMHLMDTTLTTLKTKGHKISKKEFEAALVAILLHDVGHGPFSHALEFSILKGVPHEQLSHLIMEYLNEQLDGQLKLAIKMFTNRYKRKFFHQLVSSQLDMDRLDYLQRDCFFTGVIEGKIGLDRIIRMLDVSNDDQIVVEEKGIYSIENFLNARRLMYWQVYLHKTTVSTEQMLTQLIRRARDLVRSGEPVTATPALNIFLQEEVTLEKFREDTRYLEHFASLDDYDIWGSLKFWAAHPDPVLSKLSNMLMHRKLFRVEFSSEPFPKHLVHERTEQIQRHMGISAQQAAYFCTTGNITNAGYMSGKEKILVKTKQHGLIDIAKASDLPNIEALRKIVKKFYLCSPKLINLSE